MMEEMMQEEPMQEESAAPAGEDPRGMPKEMEQQVVEGGKALFYTGAQVIAAKSGRKHVEGLLKDGGLTPATWFVVTESVKHQKRAKETITPPMMIAATPYIAGLLARVGQKFGMKHDPAQVKKTTLEVVDKIIGRYMGAKALAQHKQRAQGFAQAQAQAQQEMPPEGMGAPAPQMPPQGGMM